MKSRFSKYYKAALLAYLKASAKGRARRAHGFRRVARAAGLQTLDMAKLHEKILVTQVLPGRTAGARAKLIRQAGAFFTETITSLDDLPRDAAEPAARLNQIVAMLSQRTVELASSNLELELEVTQRKAAEEALKKSERHYSQLLAQSERLQEQLRQLSRQILSAQEDERKRISRELHDVIAQTLTGINLRLATLKKEAAVNIKGLDRNIARTQRMVEKSVDIVHQFARELRPAVLDDLGLIPALHTFLKNFTERTGVRTKLTAFAGIEQLDIARRTALFRVAQEALTNVARHARATLVEVCIEQRAGGIRFTIKDNGQSFQVGRASRGKGGKRLGLLGMKERLEMVGGRFEIVSAPGEGTTVRAEIPCARPRTAPVKKPAPGAPAVQP